MIAVGAVAGQAFEVHEWRLRGATDAPGCFALIRPLVGGTACRGETGGPISWSVLRQAGGAHTRHTRPVMLHATRHRSVTLSISLERAFESGLATVV